MTTSPHKQYLPNLDALRFLAFAAVFMAHAYHPVWPGMELNSVTTFIRDWMQVGVLGVNFFFVLSGFLITRLLLMEGDGKGSIDIPRFYLRRILRIWPLYFIIILLVVIYYHFIPGNLNTHWLWILFFAANFHIIRFGFPYAPALANLWTISVEEQFYITFPWVLKVAGRKFLPYILGAIVLASVVFRAVYIRQSGYLYFHSFSIMGDFTIGALCAYFSLNEKWLERIISLSKGRIIAGYVVIVFTLTYYSHLFNNPLMIVFERVILSCMFAFIILEQVFSVNSFFKAGRIRGLSYAGKISYGLYMYHAFALQLAGEILKHYNMIQFPFSYMFLYPLMGLVICYGISVMSYELLEKKILALKRRFGTLG